MMRQSRQHMTCRLGNLKSSHCGRWKNRVFVFSSKISFQPIFYPKHPENILETLLNQSMPTQKPTNRLKTRNPPKIKILLELRSVVLCVFKVKKHLNVTPPHHMEPFNTKINHFVARISPNNHFLFLG
jgi:hypothetical protein